MRIETSLHLYTVTHKLIGVIKVSSPTEATIEKIMNHYPEVAYSELKKLYVK